LAAEGYTIGEVLNQLKEDFEDITISKIRFLESEGLISPDRTDSGYRKFTDDDVDRLRFILTAQRDHYLPLKVIREQLERLDAGGVADPHAGIAPQLPGIAGAQADGGALGVTPSTGEGASAATGPGHHGGEVPAIDAPIEEVEFGVRELCEATGLDPAEVRSLREFGILGGREDEGAPFDAEDLAAARTSRDLLRLGLEPRHLRMYRQFAEREVALFSQLVTPMLRQRNPEARRQVARQLESLSQLTSRLQATMLARVLRAEIHHGP
jgi:DNA-binding transcriptional MerR regulator